MMATCLVRNLFVVGGVALVVLEKGNMLRGSKAAVALLEDVVGTKAAAGTRNSRGKVDNAKNSKEWWRKPLQMSIIHRYMSISSALFLFFVSVGNETMTNSAVKDKDDV